MGFTLNPPDGLAGAGYAWHDTLRKWANAINPFGVSVLDVAFAGGADPSGVADSTAAIQACWAAAPAYSCVSYPPASSGQALYKITSALVHPAKPLYHLAPRGGAIIKRTGGAGNTWESNGADDWSIDGLILDGDYPTRTVGRVLQVSDSTGWQARNFRVQNAPEMGIAIGTSSNFLLEHFAVHNTKVSGIWLGEGDGNVEDFTFAHGRLTSTNVSDAGGHSGFQTFSDNPGGVQTVINRRGHFTDVDISSYTARGFGMDFITDSEFWGCKARGSHTGEAFALTGARNRVYGGQFGEATAAAGLLLWLWAGNDQDGADTLVDGVYLPGPGSGNQGLAIVPAESGVTAKRILVRGIRAHGWGYGIQSYDGPGAVTLADDGTVLIRDSHLTGNTNAAYTFSSPFTPVLRGNLTAADTIDA